MRLVPRSWVGPFELRSGRKADMKYLQFVEQVAERTDVSLGEAEALTRATLRTLAERVSGGQARDLAAQLAVELTPYLTESDEAAEAFTLTEFVRRVAVRANVDRETAADGVRGVLQTIRSAVSGGEFDDVMSQ